MKTMEFLKNKPTISDFFTMLYTTAVISSLALTNKIVKFHSFLISGCLFTFPLLYLYGDIIAEVYGYNEAKRLIWYTLISGFLFSISVSLVMDFPSPAFYNNTDAFKDVFGLSIKFIVIAVIAILAGSFTNAYIISKWKILIRGKYFWMRSLGSTAVGELLNSVIAFPLAFGGIIPSSKIVNMIVVAYVFKMLYASVAVYPASLIVTYLKNTKGIDVYDYDTNFNPFFMQ